MTFYRPICKLMGCIVETCRALLNDNNNRKKGTAFHSFDNILEEKKLIAVWNGQKNNADKSRSQLMPL